MFYLQVHRRRSSSLIKRSGQSFVSFTGKFPDLCNKEKVANHFRCLPEVKQSSPTLHDMLEKSLRELGAFIRVEGAA